MISTGALLQKELSPADRDKLWDVWELIGHGFKGVAHKILEPFDSSAHQKDAEVAMARKRAPGRAQSLLCAAGQSRGEGERSTGQISERRGERVEAQGDVSGSRDRVIGADHEGGRTRVFRAGPGRGQGQGCGRAASEQLEHEVNSCKQNEALKEELSGWQAVVEENKTAFEASQEELEAVKAQLLVASEEVVVAKSAHQHEKNELTEKHGKAVAIRESRPSISRHPWRLLLPTRTRPWPSVTWLWQRRSSSRR